VSDAHDIYRKDALDHYLAANEFGVVTRLSPPWTWAILLVSLAAVLTAIVTSMIVRVDVTDRAAATFTGPARAVAFLPKLPANDSVRLELAGGIVRGRIVTDVRSGGISPRPYRVEIATDANEMPPFEQGMRAEVRYTVRRDRLIVILCAPLRRWLS